jgi:hypothetical protein
MPQLEWRSSAAQTFIGGRVTKIEGYWRAQSLCFGIYNVIDAWDLWDDALGPVMGTNLRKEYNDYKGRGGVVGSAFQSLFKKKTGPNVGEQLVNRIESDVIKPLDDLCKSSSLVINFKADGWFSTQAGFDEYVAMWQIKSNPAGLADNGLNPPVVRAKADRWALYGQFGEKGKDGKADVQSSQMKLPYLKRDAHGGAAPATFAYQRDKQPGYQMSPADTQVFAALNYGRRRHGANSLYGKSHFVLSDEFKKNALFFAMDTFTPVFNGAAVPKANRGQLYQLSAQTFGGAVLLAMKSQFDAKPNATLKTQSVALAKELLTCARLRTTHLEDNQENHLFIEAHLFQKVKMNTDCISKVVLSQSELTTPAMRHNLEQFRTRTRLPLEYVS